MAYKKSSAIMATATAVKTTLTKNLDRWDLIADRELGVSELGWAIAEANPELCDLLILPAGISLIIPDAATLRRPLTAANPAREDDGEFLPLPADDSPAPIPTGGGVVGNYVPLDAVGITVAPLFNGAVPIGYLPAYPTLASLNAVSADAIGVSVAPLFEGIVPGSYLPTYPTLTSLGAVSTATFNTAIALKADASAVSAALALKPDTSAVSAALALKLDTATFNTAIALKLDVSAFNTAIALKADTSAVNTALALKADASAVNTALALKLDTATFNTAIVLKLDVSTFNTAIALKLDTSTRNAANGVAGLDANSSILAAQVPTTVQFTQQARTSATVFDFNTLSANHAAIKWIDSNASHANIPSGATFGGLLQYDPLKTVSGATDLYRIQTFFNYGNRVWDRYQNNGTWASWNERCYLNRAQSFTALQDFTASASFKGGSIPTVTTTLVQAGVDSSGQPIVWLVNASATTGNRLKSITIGSNGNIKFTHYADDGTPGNVFQHTASGNVITNGTLVPGGGNTAFTGAQFVPGAFYFRNDLFGDSGSGCATYSDGVVWRRVGDGTLATDPARLFKTFTGTTPAAASFNFAHGLTLSKIKGVDILIAGFPPAYSTATYGGSAEYNYSITATDFYVVAGTNKTAISSQSYSITIMYNS